jgi:hypothetical protein
VPGFPERNNPSGGKFDQPFLYDGVPVSPAVLRVREGAAAAQGYDRDVPGQMEEGT